MKVRYLPPSLQNGLRALTTPAPLVHRVPTPSKGHHRDPAIGEGLDAGSAVASIDVIRLCVLYETGDGEAVLRQTDATGTEILPDLFLLEAVETMSVKKSLQ